MPLPTFYTPINRARALLAQPHVIGDGLFTVDSGTIFGNPSPSNPVKITASVGGVDAHFAITNRSGNVLTISAMLEGTADMAVPSGAAVEVRITAKDIKDLQDSSAAGNVAIGGIVSGGVAGRVLYEGAGPVLADAAGLTFDGTTLGVTEVDCYRLGSGCIISGFGATAIGYHARSDGYLAMAVGWSAHVGGDLGLALGPMANVSHDFSIAIGYAAVSTRPNQLVVGSVEQGNTVDEWVAHTGPAGFRLRPQGLSSVAVSRDLGYISAGFVVATDALYTSYISIGVQDYNAAPGGREGLRVESDGAQAIITITGPTTVVGTLKAHRPTGVQTGTAYTLALADADTFLSLDNAAAITLTVPPNSSVAFPIDTEIDLLQDGAGQVTVAAGAGVTIHSFGGKVALGGQYAGATLKKRGTNVWKLIGNLV